MYNLPRSALLALLIALVVTSVDAAHGQPHRDGFHATFDALPDRIWLGPEFWANPMEDWAIGNGRIECRSAAGNRNVHLLTHQLGPGSGGFFMSVLTGVLKSTITAATASGAAGSTPASRTANSCSARRPSRLTRSLHCATC
jgi:hypothetical protein